MLWILEKIVWKCVITVKTLCSISAKKIVASGPGRLGVLWWKMRVFSDCVLIKYHNGFTREREREGIYHKELQLITAWHWIVQAQALTSTEHSIIAFSCWAWSLIIGHLINWRPALFFQTGPSKLDLTPVYLTSHLIRSDLTSSHQLWVLITVVASLPHNWSADGEHVWIHTFSCILTCFASSCLVVVNC